MQTYLNLLNFLLESGEKRMDRTGTGTLSHFVYTMDFDLTQGLPIVTTKKIHLKSVVHELLWMLGGNTNIAYLKEHGVSIWDEWADEKGELGPVYGAQWRNFGAKKIHLKNESTEPQSKAEISIDGVDQISELIKGIKENPTSRRHIVSAWNPVDTAHMKLPPCHCFFQFYVDAQNNLSCHLLQRSGDAFLGIPFNIAFYSILTHLVAQVCGLKPHRFVHTINDVHLYLNHVEQAKLQLTRAPKSLPYIKLNTDVTNIFDFKFEDIQIKDYEPYPSITAPVAV